MAWHWQRGWAGWGNRSFSISAFYGSTNFYSIRNRREKTKKNPKSKAKQGRGKKNSSKGMAQMALDMAEGITGSLWWKRILQPPAPSRAGWSRLPSTTSSWNQHPSRAHLARAALWQGQPCSSTSLEPHTSPGSNT